jgi:hypothetical protein
VSIPKPGDPQLNGSNSMMVSSHIIGYIDDSSSQQLNVEVLVWTSLAIG